MLFQRVGGDGLPETGPACARVELCPRAEQRQAAGEADIGARHPELVVLVAERRFGAVLEEYPIAIVRQ